MVTPPAGDETTCGIAGNGDSTSSANDLPGSGLRRAADGKGDGLLSRPALIGREWICR